MDVKLYSCDRIWHNLRIASFDPAVDTAYGLLDQHLLGVRGEQIQVIAPEQRFDPGRFQGELIDGRGGLLTPGLIDSHTHLVYGGQRAAEFEQRLQGASYTQIARRGGGILSTVRATRALSEEQLSEQSLPRLLALAAEGVTCVEIKSGYGLTLEDELKMLRVARRLTAEVPVRIRTTLLAAHTVPPEYKERAADYIDLVCRELIPRVAAEGLADAVDVFCEAIAFDLAQTRRIFETAREHDLAIKVHAEQLSTTGAAALAAAFGACSADHLEYLDEAGITAMQHAGTVATLLPGAFYTLGETRRPPIDQLRRAGVPIALASDLNPGSSPLASLLLMLNLGCTLFGLTPEEALRGVTRHAARALGLQDRLGMLAEGYQADMLLWSIEHPAQLCSEFGWHRPQQRTIRGADTLVPNS